MSGHTKEPYTVNGAGGDFTPVARLYPHGVLISASQPLRDEIDTARRIVACVNALEGVEDPPAALKDARQALRLALPYVQNSYECASVEIAIISALLKLGGAR